jgi:hypothetical protein
MYGLQLPVKHVSLLYMVNKIIVSLTSIPSRINSINFLKTVKCLTVEQILQPDFFILNIPINYRRFNIPISNVTLDNIKRVSSKIIINLIYTPKHNFKLSFNILHQINHKYYDHLNPILHMTF